MTRTLPNVPEAVIDALTRTQREVSDIKGSRDMAADEYRSHCRQTRTPAAFEFHRDEADNLITWIGTVRDTLGRNSVFSRLRGSDAAITLVSHEIWLDETPNAPRGHLKTRLDINLDPGRYLDIHAWYNGFRMTGGGIFRSGIDLYHSLHPAMIHAIHELAAEGQLWDRLVTSFKDLVERAKDR